MRVQAKPGVARSRLAGCKHDPGRGDGASWCGRDPEARSQARPPSLARIGDQSAGWEFRSPARPSSDCRCDRRIWCLNSVREWPTESHKSGGCRRLAGSAGQPRDQDAGKMTRTDTLER